MTPDEIHRFMQFSGVPTRYVRAEKSAVGAEIWREFTPFLNGRSLYIQGPVGTGKTFMAVALMREWWLQRPSRRPRFVVVSELLYKLRNDAQHFDPDPEITENGVTLCRRK